VRVMNEQGYLNDAVSMADLLSAGATCVACNQVFYQPVNAEARWQRQHTGAPTPSARRGDAGTLPRTGLASGTGRNRPQARRRVRAADGAGRRPSASRSLPQEWREVTGRAPWSPDTGKPVMIAAAKHDAARDALPPSAA
jgi:hypothetical protein